MEIRKIEGGLIVATSNEAPTEGIVRTPSTLVGVLGPDNQWVLMPQWRDVLSEHAGYFLVQEQSGRWGVVSPDGVSLTPFTFRRDKPAADESIKAQLFIQHFLWWQYRSMQWSIEAARSGTLAIFEGKIAKSHSDQMVFWPWGMNLEEQIVVTDPSGKYRLDDAASYIWESSTSPRQYGFYTLKFCPIKRSGSICEDAIPIPWAAVSLVLADPQIFDDRGLYERLVVDQHIRALTHLIDSLVMLSDGLHECAIDNSGTPTIADSALDARIVSETMRGIAMNLVVLIKIPRASGDLKNFTDQLPDALSKCAFRTIKEHWPNGIIPEMSLRKPLDDALQKYDEWENIFLGMVMTAR
ncbi:hypothetical protein [Ferribacterium limneticum]|uniref:hypothetical protein n=1 Tax=Ferribacterium limneticum TaxID=76259 RepID=UPI001CF81046|nr:hypothetical protein [Ferribacterium limneticum]UCV22547.1 hypothetical protein KI613_18870 [Ferribacterium limneticum]